MDFFVCPTMLISLCPAHNMRSFVFKYLDEIETIFENSLFTLLLVISVAALLLPPVEP